MEEGLRAVILLDVEMGVKREQGYPAALTPPDPVVKVNMAMTRVGYQPPRLAAHP